MREWSIRKLLRKNKEKNGTQFEEIYFNDGSKVRREINK